MSSPAASMSSELDQVHARIIQSAWLLGEAHNSLKSLVSAGSLGKEQLDKMRELMAIHKQYWRRFDALLEVETAVESEIETKNDDDPSEAALSPSTSASSHTLGKRGRSPSLGEDGDTEASPPKIQRKRARFSGPEGDLDEENQTLHGRTPAKRSNGERDGIPEDEQKTFTAQGPHDTKPKDGEGDEDNAEEGDHNPKDGDRRPPRPSSSTMMPRPY